MSDYHQMWPKVGPVRDLACVTMARDEEFFLEVLIKHYLRLCPETDFYIIDHASARPAAEFIAETFPELPPGRVNVIRIPDIQFDDEYKAMAISSLANMAVSAYQVVIASDADELVFARKGDLMRRCLASPAKVIAPLGFEFIQHIELEHAYDPNRDVLAQRRHGYFKAAESKPVIWKAPNTAGVGLHKCREPFTIAPGLILGHMRFCDQTHAQARVAERRLASFSENQKTKKYGAYWMSPAEARLLIFDRIASTATFENAEDVLKDFTKRLTESRFRNPQGYYGHDLGLKSGYCRWH